MHAPLRAIEDPTARRDERRGEESEHDASSLRTATGELREFHSRACLSTLLDQNLTTGRSRPISFPTNETKGPPLRALLRWS